MQFALLDLLPQALPLLVVLVGRVAVIGCTVDGLSVVVGLMVVVVAVLVLIQSWLNTAT